ncbi:type VI secretion system baseplate subunit TssF [uncultured Bartonella sp.]|uniref:type VI secretion system baseplate subunit TssF n=1 Tax=uncultured Bartonella sp. TaxID=104108 RepID=UPI002618A090|nr:type VI secretion system baseplate subunit TssF [uncultured Bartonella sp.]
MNQLFQDELSYLRDSGREFAHLNPKLARYLADTSTDPDVERILEGFAFLTSRVREKIDDEMSEFTISVIKLLWPNFLRAFPSTTMMKFTPVDRSITERQILPKGTVILSNPVQDQQCVFHTIADCTIYPLEIDHIDLERSRDSARIKIFFHTLSGLPLSQIGLTDLRLTFSGDMAVRQTLYLWIGRYLKSVSIIYIDGKLSKCHGIILNQLDLIMKKPFCLNKQRLFPDIDYHKNILCFPINSMVMISCI